MMVRSRLLLFFLPLFFAFPFLNRAYFVDDSYFVEIASWLKDHPEQPYHFRADDAGLQNRGWEENGFVRMVNPLAHHYYLAGLLRWGIHREWFLRLGCVLLSCFSAVFIFELARRWTQNPFLATLLVIGTPVFYLTSYSLLIDSTLAFFFLGGLYFFLRSLELESAAWSLVSGVFMGLSILSKYPGLFIIPLTAAWFILRWKKISKRYLPFISWSIGLGFLLAYSYWTMMLYGRPHILAASARMVHVFGWPKVLSFLVFFSGATLAPLFIWSMAGRRFILVFALFIVACVCVLASSFGGFSLSQASLLALLLMTSAWFLIFLWKSRKDWVYPRDHFLFIWIIGFVAMMLLVMDWVAVRYYAIVAPAVVFSVVRLSEITWKEKSVFALKASVVFVFTASFFLAYADFKQAEPSRLLKDDLKRAGFSGGDRHFYLGDSFTMSYLRGEGWIPCFQNTVFQVGDLILAKEVTMPLVWFARKPVVLNKLAVFDFPTSFPVKVMDYKGSAGFYASVWGALPFTFSIGPWERFHLFQVVGLKNNEPS